jgi:AraC-like DNA-binding protein
VEDERIVARDLSESLAELGHQPVGIAGSFDEAIALLNSHDTDLVLIDIGLAGPRDGLALAVEVREEFPCAIAFLTSHGDRATVARAAAVRPNGYLLKPFDIRSLDALVGTALANHFPGARALDAGRFTDTRPEEVMRLTGEQLARLDDYIDHRLDRPIHVQELSAACGMSERAFTRRFVATRGISPYRYVVEQRLAEAKRLLRNTRWPIIQVAIASGFKNQSHFTSSFRRLTGATPAAYRAACAMPAPAGSAEI